MTGDLVIPKQGKTAVAAAAIEHLLDDNARLRALVAELTAALEDASKLCDYLERNRKAMSILARKAGWPEPWQVGYEPKIARIRAALAKASKERTAP